jgi:pimeloyl-ACP methyl ester carboxylesterase
MSVYVLVHGAWGGSWVWKRIRKGLQACGHDVFTPTLTGVGERSHLRSRQVDLDTHIADVVNLIRWEELSDVVLCGHSYGGCVVTGAADRLADRISALVYVDAFVPENGQSLHDTLPVEQREAQVQGALATGDGWRGSSDSGGSVQCQCPRSRVGQPATHAPVAGYFSATSQTDRSHRANSEYYLRPGDRLGALAVSSVL